jgi:hypothetical protein
MTANNPEGIKRVFFIILLLVIIFCLHTKTGYKKAYICYFYLSDNFGITIVTPG